MSTNSSSERTHWHDTQRLMIIHLAIWAFFAFVVHIFAVWLNQYSFVGFPIGFYMAAQGSLAVFLVQIITFVIQQDRIDKKHGVAETDS